MKNLPPSFYVTKDAVVFLRQLNDAPFLSQCLESQRQVKIKIPVLKKIWKMENLILHSSCDLFILCLILFDHNCVYYILDLVKHLVNSGTQINSTLTNSMNLYPNFAHICNSFISMYWTISLVLKALCYFKKLLWKI